MSSQIIDNLVIPKTSGSGIKVDAVAPTFGWRDITSKVEIRGVGGTDPAYTIYRTPIRQFQFEVNEETYLEFHMPHDYVPNTDVYLHFHWSQNQTISNGSASGVVTGGTVTWGANVSYAKGHQQAGFSAPVAFSVTSPTVSGTIYFHNITEGLLAVASPGAGQLDRALLEPDGLILARVILTANNMTVASGSVPHPYLHFVDLHYQSTGIGTKDKTVPFYGA